LESLSLCHRGVLGAYQIGSLDGTEAWNVEHNNRHHYKLSEVRSADLVEANLTSLRDMPVPVFFKYAAVLFFIATWKWFYYAPNTYKELKLAALRKAGKPLVRETGRKHDGQEYRRDKIHFTACPNS
jgi:hypothetical protein